MLQTQGGGNCANALTGAARLGLQPVMVTKIGDDNLGDAMLQVSLHNTLLPLSGITERIACNELSLPVIATLLCELW